MPPTAAIVIPTRGRPAYLDVALASIAPQAPPPGAEIVVVDDGPDAGTRAVAERHGARYVLPPGRAPRAERRAQRRESPRRTPTCSSSPTTTSRVWDGWLAALLAAAADLPDDVGVLTGPIRARIEDHRFPRCGRETGPVTEQDFGPADADAPHAWGANLAIRRSALERVGPFDPALSGGGDEEEWERRWLASGGRIRAIAAAGVDHRRAGRRRAAALALPRRPGPRARGARATTSAAAPRPPVAAELRTLAALRAARRRCAAASWARSRRGTASAGVEAALRPGPPPPAQPGVDDFLSGRSGTSGGRRAQLAGLHDRALDARAALSPARRRLDRAARALPRRRVLVLTVARDDVENRVAQARAELATLAPRRRARRRPRHRRRQVRAPQRAARDARATWTRSTGSSCSTTTSTSRAASSTASSPPPRARASCSRSPRTGCARTPRGT